ncbi:hypothetical protein NQZ68_012041 [Dissostichus eleginoides]|nr:hypothetical protein NQZ68_012041 [Dissostichus eleginoides]
MKGGEGAKEQGEGLVHTPAPCVDQYWAFTNKYVLSGPGTVSLLNPRFKNLLHSVPQPITAPQV